MSGVPFGGHSTSPLLVAVLPAKISTKAGNLKVPGLRMTEMKLPREPCIKIHVPVRELKLPISFFVRIKNGASFR